jgi:hypothetical protein
MAMTTTDPRDRAAGHGAPPATRARADAPAAPIVGGLPTHVWVLFGASTAGYALVLAGVTAFQAHAEASLIAARQPAVDGVAQLAAGHEALGRRLDGANADYSAAADAYVAAGGTLDALHQQVALLAGVVAEIDGVSRSMPDAVKLPAVKRSVSTVKAPTTSGTTGASGG